MPELLAALTTRFTSRDPAGRWAIGTWWHDPLTRGQGIDGVGETTRRLWGAKDSWELEWRGFPYPADLLQSLTHRQMGLRSIRVIDTNGYSEIHSSGATLRIRHPLLDHQDGAAAMAHS